MVNSNFYREDSPKFLLPNQLALNPSIAGALFYGIWEWIYFVWKTFSSEKKKKKKNSNGHTTSLELEVIILFE